MVDIQKLEIVKTDFSSGGARSATKRIDGNNEQITFKWGETMRKSISQVRGRHQSKIRDMCLSFYGIMVCRESAKEDIMKIVKEANADMKKLDLSLGAGIKFIPLLLDDSEKGEVYNKVLGAIQARIYTDLLDRLIDVARDGKVPKRSRTALVKLCERLKTWNIVNDPNVAKSLDEMKLQIENDIIEPVIADLQKEIEALKGRGAFLEFEDDAPLPAASKEVEPGAETPAEVHAEAPAEAEKPAEPEGPSGSAVEE